MSKKFENIFLTVAIFHIGEFDHKGPYICSINGQKEHATRVSFSIYNGSHICSQHRNYQARLPWSRIAGPGFHCYKYLNPMGSQLLQTKIYA